MARQTVLLVDADPRSARVFEVSLRNAGYSVTHVQSAAEAVEAIEVAIPDLVISDTRLAPSKSVDGSAALSDGYSLCRRLKDDPVWYAVPFIFLTSSASIEDKIRGLELGVEDFLTKPIYLREIITRIQLVLAKKQREGMEGRTSRASFTGLLSEMGLVDLLSTIDLGRKSGVLELEAPQGRGVVFFRDGRVVDARVNKLSGANAVYRMLLWIDGRFEIRFGPCTANEVIEMSTQGLLMEGMRRIDEWQRMREQLPALDQVFEVDVPEVLARIGEIPDEINPILRAFDGKRTLLEVVDESGIDDLEALATLTKLYFEGLIVPGKAPSGTTSDARATDDRKRDTLIGFDTDVESSRGDSSLPDENVLLPASTPGDGVPSPASKDEGSPSIEPHSDGRPSPALAPPTHPTTPVVPDGTGPAILPDPQDARPSVSAKPSQEPAVAKHRGKNRRSKREFADSTSPATQSSSLATSSTAPLTDRDDSDDDSPLTESPLTASAPASEAAKPSPSDSSGSQRALTESEAGRPVEAKSEPARSEPAKSEPVVESKSEPSVESSDAKAEGGTVIQFPRAARADEAKVDEPKVDEKKADEKKADEKKADEKKADEKKADEKKADEKKADEKKADEKKVDEKKADEKKADEKKADEKKADEKKADEKKVDEKKPNEKKADDKKKDAPKADAKADAKKPESGKRERKDSVGDLGDEAKAFFSDNSYEVAYKKTHDTFEDLEPEAAPDAPTNKRLMYATVALLVAIVGIVGGLAVYRKYFGVADATLPTGPALPEESRSNTASNSAASSGNSGGSSSSTSGSSAAGATTETDSGAATAATTTTTATEDAAAATAATESDAGAATAANVPAVEDAAAATTATNTTAVEDSGVASATNTATAANAAVDAGAPAAPSGPAELLTAAQRAQSRGAAAAATAYQAYLDAGGNDAAAIARFAFWLANRSDLGRAGEWAERATQLDPNNQLAYYVLGASKMEGPRRDPAAARAAFRRCAQLPGRYAGECRSAF